MLSTVTSEVKKEEHKDLGCHMLVIMTHGGLDNHIYGTDMKRVKLTDVYDLLTPLNFPGMAGKPKVVILEVCSGGNQFKYVVTAKLLTLSVVWTIFDEAC